MQTAYAADFFSFLLSYIYACVCVCDDDDKNYNHTNKVFFFLKPV